jgi:hypothetical protein
MDCVVEFTEPQPPDFVFSARPSRPQLTDGLHEHDISIASNALAIIALIYLRTDMTTNCRSV